MIRKKAVLLIFAGTVGSGKTTHINLLFKHLKRKAYKVKKTQLKSNCLLAYYTLNVIGRILGVKSSRNYLIRDLFESNPHLLKRIGQMWLLLDFFSVLIVSLVRVIIPLKLGYIVLCEDFLPATVTDYYFFAKNLRIVPLGLVRRLSRLLLFMIPNNSAIIFLDANNSLLKQRWKHRRTRAELEEYISAQREIIALQKILFERKVQLFQINTGVNDIMTTAEYVKKYFKLMLTRRSRSARKC